MPPRRTTPGPVCRHCGMTFRSWRSAASPRAPQFCSRACSAAFRKKPLAQRFAEGVGETTPSGCVLWRKSLKQGWHGQISNGLPGKAKRLLVASRVAYELSVGPIPPGMFVLHRCDNPRCVNPDHLFLGTQTDNMADMVTKGRQAKGQAHPGAKLTPDLVRQIRLRGAQGECHRRLAAEFGVSPTNVCLIIKRLRWAHVP